MSNEMKASVSGFKHKFYDECIDVPFEMPDGITAEELESAVAEIAKRSDECFARLLESCEDFDNQNSGIAGSLVEDDIDPNFLREFIERVKRSASLGRIEIPEWVVTDDDFIAWVRSDG